MGSHNVAVVQLRRLNPDDWMDWRAARLRALEESPDAFTATMADWTGASDTEDRWRGRLELVPVNLLAEVDDRVVGMVSVTAVRDGTADLLSMWVAPEARGRGVADALIQATIAHARAMNAERLGLDVRTSSHYAIALYSRWDFIDVGWTTPPSAPSPERRMLLDLVHVG